MQTDKPLSEHPNGGVEVVISEIYIDRGKNNQRAKRLKWSGFSNARAADDRIQLAESIDLFLFENEELGRERTRDNVILNAKKPMYGWLDYRTLSHFVSLIERRGFMPYYDYRRLYRRLTPDCISHRSE